jgi:hypothetical protein
MNSQYIHDRINKAIQYRTKNSYEKFVLKQSREYINGLERLIKEMIPQHETVVSSGDDGCASCYKVEGHSEFCPVPKLESMFKETVGNPLMRDETT